METGARRGQCWAGAGKRSGAGRRGGVAPGCWGPCASSWRPAQTGHCPRLPTAPHSPNAVPPPGPSPAAGPGGRVIVVDMRSETRSGTTHPHRRFATYKQVRGCPIGPPQTVCALVTDPDLSSLKHKQQHTQHHRTNSKQPLTPRGLSMNRCSRATASSVPGAQSRSVWGGRGLRKDSGVEVEAKPVAVIGGGGERWGVPTPKR